MLQVRRSKERGQADHGWLKTHHTFSFADYYDPDFMGFKSLRVINEDYIAEGRGFGAHPHNDMEIITYIVEGALQHKDSMGTTAVIQPGEVQHMSAGRGVMHSEFNPSETEPTHLLQIWILPDQKGGEPAYGQKSFAEKIAGNKLVLVVSKDGREGSIPIRQDADIYISRLAKGDSFSFELRKNRGLWLQVIKGSASVNGKDLQAGDAIAAVDEDQLKVSAGEQSEIMLFDLI